MLNNPTQLDSDNIGNACDPDTAPVTNDCVINFLDLGALRLAFFSVPGSANWNPAADFNGNGVVNVQDLAVLRPFFLNVPGPSGLNSSCAAK